MNIMKLYVRNRPKLSSSYNMDNWDTNIFIPISALPLRHLSHLADADTSRTLEDWVIRICNENRIKTAYCNQCKFDSFDLSDNEDEGVIGLVEKSDDDDASYFEIWLWY